jgi:hypothetical protein
MRYMPRLILLASVAVGGLVPLTAAAQGFGGGSATPLALDLKKVHVGAWAEYRMSMGEGPGPTMKARWALVSKDAQSNTLEMLTEGQPLQEVGGKMLMRMTLVPDPVGSDHPVKQMVTQLGDHDPMEIPLDLPGMPPQRFEKPDPKKLVGKETLKVPAGTFKTSHYRDESPKGTVDVWVTDQVPPLGMVKVVSTPKAGAKAPNGQPLPPMRLELVAQGKDAKAGITKPVKPFDPAMFGGPPKK